MEVRLALVCVVSCLAQTFGLVPLPFWEESGRSCQTTDGSSGRCRSLLLCPRVLLGYNVGKRPKICFWEALRPVVCCPTDRQEEHSSPKEPLPKCGVRFASSSSSDVLFDRPDWQDHLVVGGKLSELPWPWMVAILVKNSDRETFLCGGSMIGAGSVLTAAHCFGDKVEKERVGRYVVRAGSSLDSKGKAYAVAEVLLHPNYTSSAHYNDLALVRLEKALRGDNVGPVCLPPENLTEEDMLGRNVTVIGWGDQSYGGIRDSRLREVEISVLPRKTCNESYSRLKSTRILRGITDQFVCAGVPGGGKDACQADSGGPLLMAHRGRWTVVGVVSFGYGCGHAKFPGVYTKVSSYLKWLAENTSSRV